MQLPAAERFFKVNKWAEKLSFCLLTSCLPTVRSRQKCPEEMSVFHSVLLMVTFMFWSVTTSPAESTIMACRPCRELRAERTGRE